MHFGHSVSLIPHEEEGGKNDKIKFHRSEMLEFKKKTKKGRNVKKQNEKCFEKSFLAKGQDGERQNVLKMDGRHRSRN